MKNIYNIPANYHFFNTLSEFITQNFVKDTDSQALKNLKILLPNRRSCREFTKILNSQHPNIILPKIKAISDISYIDFIDAKPEEKLPFLENILKFKNYSKLEYLLFLAKEINKLDLFGFKKDFLESLKVSNNIAQLFEDIELQGIDLSELNEIDDSNLPENKKITLETVKILHLKIKKSLLSNDIYFGATKQNIIIEHYINFLKQVPQKHPIIIAGSTGSVLSGKKLIKQLAQNHYVIFHGLTRTHSTSENHPQFFLNSLLKFAEIEHNQVKDIKLTSAISLDTRQNFLSHLMQTHLSNPVISTNEASLQSTKSDLEENFTIIETQDQIKEAKIIATICKNTSAQKTAIITNNNDLVNYIRLELAKENIEFNDTTNKSILNSKLIEFITLILRNFENSCSSHSLLALLKHKYFNSKKHNIIIYDLETKILRQPKENSQIQGIIKASENSPNITKFLQEIHTDISKIGRLHTLDKISSYLIDLCEKFSQLQWSKILEQENANSEIHNLFQQLKAQTAITIQPKKLSNIFSNLFSQTSYFLKSNPDAKVQILSTIEARLLNFDNAIIASLNNNDFPQIEKAGWLGKKVKKDLGIDRQLKKIGQSAYDFCNHLSNKKIFLTRHQQKGGLEVIESPFLLKFKNLAKQIGANIDQSDHYNQQLQQQSNIPHIKLPKPKGSPSTEDLFDQISITDVTKLLSNPYQIYIKKILGLKELKKIDVEPGYPEFGSFIHEILENYIKNNEKEEKTQEIFEKYFKNPNDTLVWWPKFENIFQNFKKINQLFANSTNLVEKNVSLAINNTKIVGKIDRIIEKDNKIEILDYKTGQPPGRKDIISGLQSQLTIAALLLCKETETPITALSYFKLSSLQESTIKRMFKEEEISNLIIAAQDGLSQIIEHYIQNNQPFSATKNEDIKEYKCLFRSDEWEK